MSDVEKLLAFLKENYPNEINDGDPIEVAIRLLSPSEEDTGWVKAITADYVGRVSRCKTCQSRVILSAEGWVHMAPYSHLAIPDPDYINGWNRIEEKKDVP